MHTLINVPYHVVYHVRTWISGAAGAASAILHQNKTLAHNSTMRTRPSSFIHSITSLKRSALMIFAHIEKPVDVKVVMSFVHESLPQPRELLTVRPWQHTEHENPSWGALRFLNALFTYSKNSPETWKIYRRICPRYSGPGFQSDLAAYRLPSLIPFPVISQSCPVNK